MILSMSSEVTAVGFDSRPIRNSPRGNSHHLRPISKSVGFEIESIIAVFVFQTALFTSCKFVVAAVFFVGRSEVRGITPDMGMPITRSLARDFPA